MLPNDFYLDQNKRFKKEDTIHEKKILNGNFLMLVTKHEPSSKNPEKIIEMEFEILDGDFKGEKINVAFSMIKKDGSDNDIAKRIYSEICDELYGKAPEEFFELLDTQAVLKCTTKKTELATFYNVSVPYVSKKVELSVNQKETVEKVVFSDDIPF